MQKPINAATVKNHSIEKWSREAYATVCRTVKSLVADVKEQIPKIKQLIEAGEVALEDFDYLKYNGCEIIP